MPKRLSFLTGTFLAMLLSGQALGSPPPSSQNDAFRTGQVLDRESGEPIAGAVIAGRSLAVLSDGEGRFRFPARGPASIRASGYRRLELPSAGGDGVVRLPPIEPRGVYLSFYGVGEPLLRDPVLRRIASADLNALVVDIKGDRGMIPYASSAPLAAELGASRIRTIPDLRALVQDLKGRGVYLIARVVVFKDPLLAEGRPEWAVRDAGGKIWRDGEGLAWVDPSLPEVWDHPLDVAEEAAFYGFDEIQFDYVRFPDQAGPVFSDGADAEARIRAIRGFLSRARERLLPYNVHLAADIFGYSCWDPGDTSIGQHLETLAPLVDCLSPMLYPSGFAEGIPGFRNPVAAPYEIVLKSLNRARERTGLPPVRFRPWLQAFRDYAFDRRAFGPHEVREQIRAAEAFGAQGWMLWNAANRYEKVFGEPEPGPEIRLTAVEAAEVRKEAVAVPPAGEGREASGTIGREDSPESSRGG